MAFDLVIRNGTVLDGTSAPPVQADVAITNGRIVHIGPVEAKGVVELDATGLLVAPGFIDIHSHSDHTNLVDPRALSALHQGVTLEVVGNCGHGCFPIRAPEPARSAIYGYNALQPLNWHNAADYFGRLEAARPAVNMLSLVPNGQLRMAVLGMKARPAQPDELRAMTRLLEEGMEQGAWGYSTGLEYAWEEGAPEEELTALSKTLTRTGGLYATHTRLRDEGSVEAVGEAIRTADRAGVPLQISHLIPRNGLEAGRQCIELVNEARSRGQDVAFDMHTRVYGTNYLHNALPPDALAGGLERLKTLLADSSARAAMKGHRSILSAGGDWDRIVLLDNPYWPQYARRSVGDVAAERGQDAFDTIFDLMLGALEDTSRMMMIIINCHTADQLHETFMHDACVPGSDATTIAPDGPHADKTFHGAYTWAAWFYRFMVRERKSLSPAEAVHKLSGQPAERMGLKDRGTLREGAWADLAIFDHERFGEKGTTYMPNVLADGMVHVVVNGVISLRDGVPTGDRAGAVLRRN